MKSYFTLLIVLIFPFFGMAQIYNTVKGKIVSSETLAAMESVNIVNLNQVIGTTTNTEGQFEIRAKANDTLHLSYLGYKSIKVKVSNDWIKYGTSTTIELTELALCVGVCFVFGRTSIQQSHARLPRFDSKPAKENGRT